MFVHRQSRIVAGDFIRPVLPMDYGVALRRNFNSTWSVSLSQVDRDLRSACFQYLNFDRSSTLDETLALSCDSSQTLNKTISGITVKKNFNGLMSIGLRERRMSAHHVRIIDYEPSE